MLGKVISAILLPSQMTSTGSVNSMEASNGPLQRSRCQSKASAKSLQDSSRVEQRSDQVDVESVIGDAGDGTGAERELSTIDDTLDDCGLRHVSDLRLKTR